MEKHSQDASIFAGKRKIWFESYIYIYHAFRLIKLSQQIIKVLFFNIAKHITRKCWHNLHALTSPSMPVQKY